MELTQLIENLQGILQKLKELLESNTEIDEVCFCKVVGDYSKELKLLLNNYFKADDALKNEIRPFLNYYRQLQHYLIYLIRYPTILKVPSHAEILQTLSFIENQDFLIAEKYISLSEAQKQLLSGDFIRQLDELLE